MKVLFVSTLMLFSLACATSSKSQALLTSLDIFGSKRISADDVSVVYGAKINDFVVASKTQSSAYPTLKSEIESDIKNKYGFAYVQLSLITYFDPNSGDYVTIDVVEPADAAKRMDFLPEPTGKFEDPDGLIALWDQYQKLGFELLFAGQFDYPKACLAWHCIHGFEHPKLAPFLEKFNRLVPTNEKKLVRILKEDARPQYRGNAAFLLAHIKSGPSVIQYTLGSVEDSSELVRNNVVRVLSEIASKHPELEIPVMPILKVLNFPAATDRNKAGYTLVGLSLKEKNKKLIAKQSGSVLLEMLRLQQPNNHDPAYAVLKNISGKNFGDRDYLAWETWLEKQR
jgi:hypothetical protein